MSFQVLLRSFLVFKCSDQNFAGWLVTSKRNPTERVAPSPRPFPRIASGRLETKYSFPDFSPKISALEIHEISMATSHASRYSDLNFFFVFVHLCTSISLVLILLWHCDRFILDTAWLVILSHGRSSDARHVYSRSALLHFWHTGFALGYISFLCYLQRQSVGCSGLCVPIFSALIEIHSNYQNLSQLWLNVSFIAVFIQLFPKWFLRVSWHLSLSLLFILY